MRFHLLARLVAVAAVFLFNAAVATAQTDDSAKPPEISEETLSSPEAVRSMVARMSDEQVREILLERLEAVAEEHSGEESEEREVVAVVEALLVGPFVSAADAVRKLPAAFAGQAKAIGNFVDERGAGGATRAVLLIIVAVGAGVAARYAATLIGSGWRKRIRAMAHPGASLRDKLKALFLRLLLDIAGLAAFYFVTRGILVAFVRPEDAPITRAVVIYVALMPMLVAAATRFILAPRQPELRLVNADDATARNLQSDIFGVVTLIGATLALLTFNNLNGVPPAEIRLGFWLSLAIFAWIGIAIWRNRNGLVRIMRGYDEDLTPIEDRVARAYPRYAMASLVLCWLVGEAFSAAGLERYIMNAEPIS